MNEFSSLNFSNKLEAKNKYIEILQDNDLFQSCQFICRYDAKMNNANNNSQHEANPNHITEDCIVAIKPKEILILDANRNKIYTIPITLLASWGVNAELFVIVEKKSDKEYSKSYFYCKQTKLFKIVLDSYTNIISGKNMIEIMTENAQTCKMFESFPAIKLDPGETARSRQASVYPKVD